MNPWHDRRKYLREDDDPTDDEIIEALAEQSKPVRWCVWIALTLLIGLLMGDYALAQEWDSTRTTTHDYACTDAAGAVISGHTRIDAAFVSCSNLTLKDGVTRFVVGGRYRITATRPQPPAQPVTGTAALTWTAPTQNTDGTALTNLAGYRILRGSSPTALTQVAQVTATSYTFTSLQPGTYYFAVRAYTTTGAESANSNVASKVIP